MNTVSHQLWLCASARRVLTLPQPSTMRDRPLELEPIPLEARPLWAVPDFEEVAQGIIHKGKLPPEEFHLSSDDWIKEMVRFLFARLTFRITRTNACVPVGVDRHVLPNGP
jgi:hypothetical protein